MKRIQRGPVRGISLKLQVNECAMYLYQAWRWQCGCMSRLNTCLQEEERERRMDFVPEESAVNTEQIEVSI